MQEEILNRGSYKAILAVIALTVFGAVQADLQVATVGPDRVASSSRE